MLDLCREVRGKLIPSWLLLRFHSGISAPVCVSVASAKLAGPISALILEQSFRFQFSFFPKPKSSHVEERFKCYPSILWVAFKPLYNSKTLCGDYSLVAASFII